MADLVQTAANVLAQSPAFTGDGVAGAPIVAGQPVYFDGTGNWWPALASGTPLQSGTDGLAFALDSAPGAGQPFTYLLSGGGINLGATLVKGTTYVLSTNTGKICPATDTLIGQYVSILGVAISTSILGLSPGGPYASGVTHP